MHDEANHICVACACIVCGEQFNMYKAHASFLARYAPGLPLQTVKMVASDDFFDENIIKEMGFPNARFIMDKFHLLDLWLKKKYDKVGYELLKSHLIRMVNSPSQSEFDSILESACQLLSALYVNGTVSLRQR